MKWTTECVALFVTEYVFSIRGQLSITITLPNVT